MIIKQKEPDSQGKRLFSWYNRSMLKQILTENNFTPIQLEFQGGYEKTIEITDEIYTFNEVISHIDLRKYFVKRRSKTGRRRYDEEKLMKIILFAFMENGYSSLRNIEKLCKTDIRYLWILDGTKAPTFMTISNFINEILNESIEEIFKEINKVIFEREKVDLEHIYIDGTKIEANANKYSWVWKKSCIGNRSKVFRKITELLSEINEKDLIYQKVKIGTRTEYSIEYLQQIQKEYLNLLYIDMNKFVYGSGKRKSIYQKHYEKLVEYTERLKSYAERINNCGEKRNSYSKTDKGATFMRVKRDYMGNDQLLPAYNIQLGVCDEYIAVADVKQYASDMDCFIPLMERYKKIYNNYPEYPVADAGYGSYNNYLYCEEKGMEKYMKFTMYEKETNSLEYHNNPFRAVNFKRNSRGNLICPNNKEFNFLRTSFIKGNNFGRTEELYQCEDCSGCKYSRQCHRSDKNRIIRLNTELTSFHREVLANLNSVKGALLRMNRSIQAEGAFGIVKNDRGYKRIRRRGLNAVNLEILMICCGFNLYKYHLKKSRAEKLTA